MRWLTPQEAAEYMNTYIGRVYELTKSGELKGHVKPWSKSRPYQLIAAEDIDEYIRSWSTMDQLADGGEGK